MSASSAAFGEALAILLAMSAAGLAHTLWMRSALSRRFAVPIDGGRRWRGRRLFGDHKTVRGFMAMVPAAGLAFCLLGLVRDARGGWFGTALWGLDLTHLGGLGAWAGFCFMAGELPNSFWKRRRGIEPGAVPRRGRSRLLCLLVDRIDSTLALLLGMSLAVGLHWQTWLAVLALGPLLHLAFSALLYAVGVKARFA
jgi:CDP-2,3-bis-(O-geranylgeranyl)-sn-glycerol synthase